MNSSLSIECSSNVRLLLRLIGGPSRISEFNDGMGRLVLNSPYGATKGFVFGVGVDGADQNSRVWSMASVDSTVRGLLPIIDTEDGVRESVREGTGEYSVGPIDVVEGGLGEELLVSIDLVYDLSG